jgi:hypothetical protein
MCQLGLLPQWSLLRRRATTTPHVQLVLLLLARLQSLLPTLSQPVALNQHVRLPGTSFTLVLPDQANKSLLRPTAMEAPLSLHRSLQLFLRRSLDQVVEVFLPPLAPAAVTPRHALKATAHLTWVTWACSTRFLATRSSPTRLSKRKLRTHSSAVSPLATSTTFCTSTWAVNVSASTTMTNRLKIIAL